jgi:hypothetical protein
MDARRVIGAVIVGGAIEKETMKAKPRSRRRQSIKTRRRRIVIACLAVNENGKYGCRPMMAGFDNL